MYYYYLSPLGGLLDVEREEEKRCPSRFIDLIQKHLLAKNTAYSSSVEAVTIHWLRIMKNKAAYVYIYYTLTITHPHFLSLFAFVFLSACACSIAQQPFYTSPHSSVQVHQFLFLSPPVNSPLVLTPSQPISTYSSSVDQSYSSVAHVFELIYVMKVKSFLKVAFKAINYHKYSVCIWKKQQQHISNGQ